MAFRVKCLCLDWAQWLAHDGYYLNYISSQSVPTGLRGTRPCNNSRTPAHAWLWETSRDKLKTRRQLRLHFPPSLLNQNLDQKR